jgi:acyl-CoA thioesterase-1
MNARPLALAALLSLFAALPAAQEARKEPTRPAKKKELPAALAPIKDVAGLPRVLLIGDSISMGYTLPVRELLRGVANVHRPPTNCGPTTRGVEQIDAWLGDGRWDVIHFNFGLHDLKHVDGKGKNASPDKGKVQVPLERYGKNLDALVVRMRKTGAKLIFATTTPVPPGEKQRAADSDRAYNEAALKVMNEHKVAIDDLNALVRDRKGKGQLTANVHFTQEGYKALAAQVAAEVKKALGK